LGGGVRVGHAAALAYWQFFRFSADTAVSRWHQQIAWPAAAQTQLPARVHFFAWGYRRITKNVAQALTGRSSWSSQLSLIWSALIVLQHHVSVDGFCVPARRSLAAAVNRPGYDPYAGGR
jgi:hypothetical protein